MTRIDNMRVIRAARGTDLTARSWLTEAPMRMLMNTLDPEVAEKPGELVVYGGIGRGRRHYGGSLAGKWILTAGMGGAQPLAAVMAGARTARTPCRTGRC